MNNVPNTILIVAVLYFLPQLHWLVALLLVGFAIAVWQLPDKDMQKRVLDIESMKALKGEKK